MIFEKLQTVVAEQFLVSVDSITTDTSFADDLGADSIDIVELTMALEEAFDILEVDDETIVGMDTVGDVLRYISARCD